MTLRRLARLLFVGATLVAVPIAPAATAPAMPAEAGTADLERFFDALAPYGDWVAIRPYGTVWVPDVEESWRPYERGRWTYADRHGWYWESREPWAWATYHYGGWVHIPRHGWAWVPGRVWAPAWVVWRTGGGHIGWAPAPPKGVVTRLPDSAWVFVREPDFLARNIAAVAAPPEDAARILPQATRSGSARVSGKAGVNTFIDRGIAMRSTGDDIAPRPGFPERIYPPADIPSLPPARGLPDDDFDEPYLADPRFAPEPGPEFEAGPGWVYPTRPSERGPAAALPHDDAAPVRPRGSARAAPSAASASERPPPGPPQARLPAALKASPTPDPAPSARKTIDAAPLPEPSRAPAPAQPSRPAEAREPARPQRPAAATTRAAQKAEPTAPAADGRKPCTPEQAKAEADNCRPVRVIR